MLPLLVPDFVEKLQDLVSTTNRWIEVKLKVRQELENDFLPDLAPDLLMGFLQPFKRFLRPLVLPNHGEEDVGFPVIRRDVHIRDRDVNRFLLEPGVEDLADLPLDEFVYPEVALGHGLETSTNLLDVEGLDDIPLFVSIEIIDPNPALVTGANFRGIVLETFERRDLSFENRLPLT